MRDSFLRRAGATRFSVMVALIGTFRAGPSRKERKEAERLCLPFRQASHFAKGNLHASLFAPASKEQP